MGQLISGAVYLYCGVLALLLLGVHMDVRYRSSLSRKNRRLLLATAVMLLCEQRAVAGRHFQIQKRYVHRDGARVVQRRLRLIEGQHLRVRRALPEQVRLSLQDQGLVVNNDHPHSHSSRNVVKVLYHTAHTKRLHSGNFPIIFKPFIFFGGLSAPATVFLTLL